MTTPEQRVRIGTPRGDTSGVLAIPAGARAALAVAHGAGGTMDGAFLAGFTGAMNDGGVATLRFNFLYAEQGRRAPDPESRLRQAWITAFDILRARSGTLPVFAGGKSLGGRIASMAAADGEIDPAGLVFLGYPLHPPGKPEKVRDEHLYRLGIPMLFLQGTADPFAREEVLAPVLETLGRRATLVPVEGGDHSFRVKGARRDDREIGASLAADALAFVGATVSK